MFQRTIQYNMMENMINVEKVRSEGCTLYVGMDER